jgi:ubiquinone/menaquinone biosynthesis C-methylase UbiE
LTHKVNYDQIAPTFDQRYAGNLFDGIAGALLGLATSTSAKSILEVGCGTGHWLAKTGSHARRVFGLDLSMGMLQKAREGESALSLVRGSADQLPFRNQSFDLVFSVNAIHHFARPDEFVREARRLLKPGGSLASIALDPHHGHDRWYVYDYFPETLEIDRQRYPSVGRVADWMIAAGFDRVECRVAERIAQNVTADQILRDPMLHKNSTSQLVLLSDEAYAAGMARIKAAIQRAHAGGEPVVFPVDVSLMMEVGSIA